MLYKLLEHFCKDKNYLSPEEAFKGKRILILHSGGDSRRLPAYSAVGKIFIPLPTSPALRDTENRGFSTDGPVTLYDLLLNNLLQLPCLSDGQVIVASGDVLLSFDASKVAFSDSGSGLNGLGYEQSKSNPLNPLQKSADSGWVSIIYGIEDDFKKFAEDDAVTFLVYDRRSETFLNDTFHSWMEENEISPTVLWEDSEPHELWNARLFPFNTNPAESMRISLSLQVEHAASLLYLPGLRPKVGDQWRESPRMSLREILESVDYERFLDNYSNLYRKVNLETLVTILTPKSNLSSEEILSWCVEADDYTTAIKMTLALISPREIVCLIDNP